MHHRLSSVFTKSYSLISRFKMRLHVKVALLMLSLNADPKTRCFKTRCSLQELNSEVAKLGSVELLLTFSTEIIYSSLQLCF